MTGLNIWISVTILLVCCSTIFSKNEDICELSHTSMYCTCETNSKDEMTVTCFIFGPLNPTDSVWKGFGLQPTITELTFNSRLEHKLNFVPTDIFKMLPKLRLLQFRQSTLGTLETFTFSNFNVSEIYLESNEITELKSESFSDLKNLVKLSLAENMLTRLSVNTFVNLPHLKDLFLDRNLIKTIEDGTFRYLFLLNELELSYNVLNEIKRETFEGLRNLFMLDLFRNQIRRLPSRVFSYMPNLRELHLKDNHITQIDPEAFFGLEELISLYMSNNKIKYLPADMFSKTSKLLTIDLSHNHLDSIQSELLDHLDSRFKSQFNFHFRGNPLKCNCDLWKWIGEYLNTSQSMIWKRELRHAKCYLPDKENQTNRISKLNPRDIDCLKSTFSAKEIIVGDITLSEMTISSVEKIPSNQKSIEEIPQTANVLTDDNKVTDMEITTTTEKISSVTIPYMDAPKQHDLSKTRKKTNSDNSANHIQHLNNLSLILLFFLYNLWITDCNFV